MIAGVIFDADGTLLDTMPLWDSAGARYLYQKGITPSPDLGRLLFPMTMQEAATYLKSSYDLPLTIPQIITETNQMIACYYREEATCKPGVPEFLSALRHLQIPMTIATSSDRPLIESAFCRLGLLSSFQAIFTSSELGKGKDVPDIYQTAARHMASPIPSTWVFEDALHAATTAAAAGFPVAGVYDPVSILHQPDLMAVTQYYIQDFTDFPSFYMFASQRT